MSTPASSAMRAPGASYAVTMTRRSPPLRARTAGAVIFGAIADSPLSSRPAPLGCRRYDQYDGVASDSARSQRTRSIAAVTTTASCDSCGREEQLERVRRLYVVPESWDT